jgi:hypothetical protein
MDTALSLIDRLSRAVPLVDAVVFKVATRLLPTTMASACNSGCYTCGGDGRVYLYDHQCDASFNCWCGDFCGQIVDYTIC